jgi:hypothetical protein
MSNVKRKLRQIPHAIAPKRAKYLGTKEVKDLYNANYKKISEKRNQLKHIYGLEDLTL